MPDPLIIEKYLELGLREIRLTTKFRINYTF